MRVQRVSRRKASRRAQAAVAALLGVLLVAGCAGQPGAAAVVDGRQIRVSDVDTATRELQAATGSGAAQRVLEWLVLAPMYQDAAARAGLAVSDEEVTAFLSEAIRGAGGEPVATFSEPTLMAGHYLLAMSAIEELPRAEAARVAQELSAEISALDIQLSPRFGGPHAGSDAPWGSAPAWFVVPGSA